MRRDAGDDWTEAVLARIAHKAGVKPSGLVAKPMPGPLILADSEEDFRARKRAIKRQAAEIEARTRKGAA